MSDPASDQSPAEQPLVDRILVELTIAAPADAVWEALRDPAKIYNWFGWDAETLEGEIDFIFAQYGRRDDATRTLSFEGMTDRFEVEARGAGCLLRVIRGVPAGDSWDDVYEDMTEGWISFVAQLRLGIERHGLGPRRTLYFSGSAIARDPAPIAALGLTGFRDTADGEAFTVDLPTGDHIEGEAWHRTVWQIGLTVPTWGNGLLIVTDKSPAAGDGAARGNAILTTYGLDDAAFAALEARWKGWWDARYLVSAGDPACS